MSVIQQQVITVLTLLREATKGYPKPMSDLIVKDFGRDPFLILISCLLSLRARDVMTYPISKKLFEKVRTPKELVQFPLGDLEELLRPIGFYKKKARTIKEVSKELITRFDSKVPSALDELLSIKGVGIKTANLVLGQAFLVPALCVDTHVHRLANRLGWVSTRNPEATERELQKIVPKEYWIELNHLFVMWGQNICVPLSPWCSKCVLNSICPKIGVTKKR